MQRVVILPVIVLVVACSQPQLEHKVIKTDKAPAAIGPYSQAIQAGNSLYLAGQIALDPATGQLIAGGIEAQTHQVLKNIKAILEVAGFTLEDVVQCQVFMTDLNHYAALNEIYASYFPKHPPARAVVQVARIPKDALLEIMVIAVSLSVKSQEKF